MARKPTDRKDHEVTTDDNAGPTDQIRHIMQRFETHQTFWNAIHQEALEDDMFVAGKQWPDQIKNEREADGRPVMTYNLLPAFTRQIINKVRQNRSQVKVRAVESNKGKQPMVENLQGSKDYSLAEVYEGLVKNIEHISRAEQAYDSALTHAVNHGFGYFELVNQYSHVDPFVQELVIKRIKNSYSIYLDPAAQELDYRDMQDAFKFTSIALKTFEAKYPEANPSAFQGDSIGAAYEDWFEKDRIRIAQYYYIDYKSDTVHKLSNGKLVYKSEVGKVLDEMEKYQGITVVASKKVRRPVCMWLKMTANEILEGPLELPYSSIPIFPVLGEELLLDGQVVYESAIRHAKDPQRSYNYWRTAAAETVALAPRNPWIISDMQISGNEDDWENANRRNLPFLKYRHIEGQSQPTRVYPSQIPAAELANSQQDGDDMQKIIGLHDASLGADGNEKSGKAILARQSQGAIATFQFPDNLSRAQEQMGRLLVEAIPRIYDTERIVRIRLPDGREDFVQINEMVRDEQSGETVLVHDIAYGRYDVTMDTGPSYQTLQQEAAQLQMELLQTLPPEKASNIVHLIVGNMNVPGAEELAGVLRKMLPDELKSQEEINADLPKGVTVGEDGTPINEDGSPYQPPPSAQQQIAMKQQELDQLELQIKQLELEGAQTKNAADIEKSKATVEKAKADMAALMAEPADNGQQLGEVASIIQQAFAEHEANPEAHAQASAEQMEELAIDVLKRVKSYIDGQKNAEAGA